MIGKSYMAAGQAGAALHTMAILQAYQAEVLKEMDEGDSVTLEAVKELCRATDLALHATKHTARAVGRSIAGLVTAERHLWLKLTEIREKEKAFLFDVPIYGSGLFSDAVNAVVDKFRAAQTQSAAFKQFARVSLSAKYLTWQINGLELRAVLLGLTHFLPFLMHSHVIVRTATWRW